MQAKHPRGFSLVELMVVVTVIGILALLAVPGIMTAAQRAEATTTANDIRVFTNAIEVYITAEGSYPVFMSELWMPDSIKEYLPNTWTDGTYNWFYVNNKGLIYIYFYNLNYTPEQMVRLDSIIDDGNIGTGRTILAFQGTGLVHLFQNN
jgi:prepilin-type N-terminal cleavage/methylation domain-containing protein